jgi:hypothetical protein
MLFRQHPVKEKGNRLLINSFPKHIFPYFVVDELVKQRFVCAVFFGNGLIYQHERISVEIRVNRE